MCRGWQLVNFLESLPQYKSYKKSGIESIELIPQGWSVKSVRYAFKFLNNQRIPLSAPQREIRKGDYPYYGASGIIDYVDGYIFDEPLILIAEDGANLLSKSTPLAFVAEGKYWVNNHAHIIKPNLPGFSYWAELLSSLDYTPFISGAAQPKLTRDRLGGIRIPVPPINEIPLISSFLEAKASLISRAISVKERQIELLKERKQILIQQAVTLGLDPHAPMRDSGIEWIGEIPSHWSIQRAKYLFREVDERSPDGQQELLSVSHLTGVTPRSEKNVTMFMSEDYTGSKTCQKDDLIFNIMWAWMGALGVSDRAGIVSSAYGIYRQLHTGTLNMQYLEMLLKTTAYIAHYNKVSTGLHSSRLRFYGHMFMSMEIAFPDREEQDAIVAHLDLESEKLNKAVDLLEQQITKLKEYKVTLIKSAVTGKIKVPGVAEPETQDMEVA